jgi:hypothetical protein
MRGLSFVLDNKSIPELRAIAEGYGIPDLFSKDKAELLQAIRGKQQASIPVPEFVEPKQNDYDSRLMTKRPAKETTKEMAIELLADHVAQGLELTFPEPDRWSMRYKDRNDSGTMRMPPRTMIYCANKLMKK